MLVTCILCNKTHKVHACDKPAMRVEHVFCMCVAFMLHMYSMGPACHNLQATCLQYAHYMSHGTYMLLTCLLHIETCKLHAWNGHAACTLLGATGALCNMHAACHTIHAETCTPCLLHSWYMHTKCTTCNLHACNMHYMLQYAINMHTTFCLHAHCMLQHASYVCATCLLHACNKPTTPYNMHATCTEHVFCMQFTCILAHNMHASCAHAYRMLQNVHNLHMCMPHSTKCVQLAYNMHTTCVHYVFMCRHTDNMNIMVLPNACNLPEHACCMHATHVQHSWTGILHATTCILHVCYKCSATPQEEYKKSNRYL